MKNKILYLIFIVIALNSPIVAICQGFNDDKVALTNFIKRMYTNSPFEGVRVVEDYDNKYLLSIVSLEKAKYTSNSIMTRVAQTKSQSQANTFFNGSTVSSDFIIRTTEQKQDSSKTKSTIETIESIKENSIGFVNGMELLTNFDIEEGKRMLFIYFKKMN
ncbi:MAG: hypothetical protein WCH34_09290 [Bacteroidota bacterium]